MVCQEVDVSSLNKIHFSPLAIPKCAVIVLSVFNNFFSSSDGGAVFFRTSGFNVSVDRSSFINCSCGDNYGGAFYFQDLLGNCSLLRTCAYYCYGTIGSFFTIDTSKYSQSSLNSFSLCYKSLSTANRYNSYYEGGNILIDNLNCTKNWCGHHISGLLCWHSLSVRLSYSTFAQNHAGTFVTIDFEGIKGINQISRMNFLNNNVTGGGFGHLLFYGNTLVGEIDNSVFFSNQGLLIYHSPSNLILNSCEFDTFPGMGETLNCITKIHMETLIISNVYNNECTMMNLPTPQLLRIIQKVIFLTHFMM